MKLLLLGVVGYAIYFFFFKKNGLSYKQENDDSETMVECASCGMYVSVRDAILKEGKYYCSKECAKLS